MTLIPGSLLALKSDIDVAVPRVGDRSLAANLDATFNVMPTIYWRLNVRANSADRTGLANTLWGWDFRPGSTAYLAYQQKRDTTGHFVLADQMVFIKVSYMFPF